MTAQISFVAYPVSDMDASRRFYDMVLGVESTSTSDEWIEYVIGNSTFAISQADADHPTPVSGALIAFEAADLDAEVARLRKQSVTFRGDIVETSVCRFIVALDPDGSEFLIHQRNPTHDATRTI